MSEITVRPARTTDVQGIARLMEPLVARRILLGKDLVDLYAAVPEFLVAEDDGEVVGCGAVHVMWERLGEVRSLCVADDHLGEGVGHRLLEAATERARALGLHRLFCLTFEVDFFSRHGFEEIGEGTELVPVEVYAELVRSNDEHVAEFLDLARVKPNTLGNTRMLKRV